MEAEESKGGEEEVADSWDQMEEEEEEEDVKEAWDETDDDEEEEEEEEDGMTILFDPHFLFWASLFRNAVKHIGESIKCKEHRRNP